MNLQAKYTTPIAQLDPLIDTTVHVIKGIVTLIWPYSASTSSLSILLVEPDFRLRRNKGQVRISFEGAIAKAVAKSGLTSGDNVTLDLLDAEWLRADSALRTPGRGIDWELHFGQHLILEVTFPGLITFTRTDVGHRSYKKLESLCYLMCINLHLLQLQ